MNALRFLRVLPSLPPAALLAAALLAPALPGGGEEEWLHSSREPLLDRKGNPAFEGRNILLSSDSHPRAAASFAEAPAVERLGDGAGFRVSFALDRPDDVLVRVLDREGGTVRTLACGVLGPNAPAPFEPDSLAQGILWDGLDGEGAPAPEGSRIEVSLGLAPRFAGFVDHDPGQLLSQIVWLETDPRGRVYAQVGTGRKTDRTMLRFDREGSHLDMPYPSNPETLASLGKGIEEVWPFTARFEGTTVPHRPRSWPSFAPYSSDWSIPYPMRIAADGTVYIAESTTGFPNWSAGDELFRVFTTHMDRFWFLEMMPLMWSMGPFAIDEEGNGYLVTSAADRCTGTYPKTTESLNDPRAPGTIRKFDLETGQLLAHFTHNGSERLDEPSAYLGTTQTVANTTVLPESVVSRSEPDPADDSDHRFLNIVDLAVDREGRLFVADGRPRRVKVYEGDGRFLGEFDRLAVDGRERRFRELGGVAWTEGGAYVLAEFEDEPGASFLLKCRTADPVRPEVVWSVPLHAGARHIAVDRTAEPPLVWVGMGNGSASLSRVTDLGDSAGEVRHAGGAPEGVLRYPWNFTVGADGTLYVYDFDRKALVRIDGATGAWREAPLESPPVCLYMDERHGRLLASFSLGEQGGYSADRAADGGFLSFDPATLERQDFRLESVYSHEQLSEHDRAFRRNPDAYYPWAKTYGGLFAGMDDEGNLYVRDAERGERWHKATPTADKPHAGVVRVYRPDGSIAEEAHLRLFNTGGGVAMDSRGDFYAVELPRVPWGTVVHDFQAAIGHQELEQVRLPSRGGEAIRTQSGLGHVVKMASTGGERDSEAELWAHRGVSGTGAGGCYCDWPDNHLAVDGADRIHVADVDLHHVRVLDTAGNMIARVGRWGNADTAPEAGGDAGDLGFRLIYCVAAAGDRLFVGDKDLRRIAEVDMDYRETALLELP